MHQRHNGHKNSLNNKDHKQHPQLSSRHLHQQNAFKPQWPWTLLKVTSIKNALNILLCHRTKDTLKPQWPQISSEQQWSRMKLKSQWPWPLFTITGIKNCPQQSAMHLPQKHLQTTVATIIIWITNITNELTILYYMCTKSTFRPRGHENNE